jgi:hypothetical protein
VAPPRATTAERVASFSHLLADQAREQLRDAAGRRHRCRGLARQVERETQGLGVQYRAEPGVESGVEHALPCTSSTRLSANPPCSVRRTAAGTNARTFGQQQPFGNGCNSGADDDLVSGLRDLYGARGANVDAVAEMAQDLRAALEGLVVASDRDRQRRLLGTRFTAADRRIKARASAPRARARSPTFRIRLG